MGCTEGLARILVFIVNFAFLLVGLALLVVGILYTVNFTKFTDAVPADYSGLSYVPTLSIVVGAVIFFIAFLGCCGALKSNTCMLTTYGAILFIIFLVQIGLGIWALVMIKDNADLQQKLTTEMDKLFGRYYDTVQSSSEAVDLIQDTFKCCGTTDRTYWNQFSQGVPKSCGQSTAGCTQTLYDFIIDSMKVIGIVALGISVVEVVAAILALCLSNCIRGRQRQGSYY